MASDKKDSASQAIAAAKVERRGFLKALGLGAGAAAAGVSADAAMTPPRRRNRATTAPSPVQGGQRPCAGFYRTNRTEERPM